MDKSEVSVDQTIIKKIQETWDESHEVWNDQQATRFGETCIPVLTGKVAEMGEEGRAVAEEMASAIEEIRETIESC